MTALNRHGEEFAENEEVRMHWGYHKSTNDKVFVIHSISKFVSCESGFMILLKDKDTGSLFKRKLDTNWLIKIKKEKLEL
jgi:hypothetical protein